MEIPDNVELIESSTSTAWFDGDGILCSVSKKGARPTIEESRAQIAEFRKRFGEQKFCMLIDNTHASPSTSKEQRDYAAEEMPRLVKALAIISNSALSRMAVNLFFGLKPPSYPAKVFNDENEARQWLRQYL